MTEIGNMIRWNANFVRGLAESVLNRARVIRETIAPAVKTAAKPKKASKPRKGRGRKAST